ncbi:MAG TPA: adventurous gliding motility protein CglE [Polyangia bacterium]|jgi:hypothetical protein
MLRRLVSALLVIGLCLAWAPARAQVIGEAPPPPFPDPKKFARGFFAEGELGALVFLGKMGRYAAAGPQFGARLGYDLFRWLALEARVSGASSNATLPPPTVNQSFQTYLYAGEARLSLQLRRFGLFAEGGAGLSQLSNNVLAQVNLAGGSLFSLAVVAGGGLDYHTLNRHFSIGLDLDYLWLQSYGSASALTATAYLRYTR